MCLMKEYQNSIFKSLERLNELNFKRFSVKLCQIKKKYQLRNNRLPWAVINKSSLTKSSNLITLTVQFAFESKCNNSERHLTH